MTMLLIRQRGEILTRVVDGEAFVITRTTIKHLNPTATMIWVMLEEPMTSEDITAVLKEIYPKTSPSQIETDVRNALASFLKDKIAVATKT